METVGAVFLGLVAVRQRPVAVFDVRPLAGPDTTDDAAATASAFAVLRLDTPESLKWLPLLTAGQPHRVRVIEHAREPGLAVVAAWLTYAPDAAKRGRFPPLLPGLLEGSLPADASLLVNVRRAFLDEKAGLRLIRLVYGPTLGPTAPSLDTLELLHFPSDTALGAFLTRAETRQRVLDKARTMKTAFVDAWNAHHGRLAAVLPLLQRMHERDVPMAYVLDALVRANVPCKETLFTGEAAASELCDLWLWPLVDYSAVDHPLVGQQLTAAGLVTPAAWATYVARAMVKTVETDRLQARSYRFMVADLTAVARGQLDCATQTALDVIQAAMPATGYYRYRLGLPHLVDQSIRLWVVGAAAAAAAESSSPPAATWFNAYAPHLPALRLVVDLPLVDCLQAALRQAGGGGSTKLPARRRGRLVAALTALGVLDRVRSALAQDPLLSVALVAVQDMRRVTHGDALARDTAEARYVPITHGDLARVAGDADDEDDEETATPRTAPGTWPDAALFGHVILVQYHAIVGEARLRDLLKRIADWRQATGYGPADGSLTFMGCAGLALGAFWRPLLDRSARYDYDLSPVLSMEFSLALSALVHRAYELKRIWLLASTERPPLSHAPPTWKSPATGTTRTTTAAAAATPGDRHVPLIPMYNAPDLVSLPATHLLTAAVLRSFNRQQLLGFFYRLVVRVHLPLVYTYMAPDVMVRTIERVLADPRTPATGHWLDSD